MSDPTLQVSKEEFRKMDGADRDWMILSTFTTQVSTCNGRFKKLEKFKLGIVILLAVLVGTGLFNLDKIVKWIPLF
jgi:hypothetical protein